MGDTQINKEKTYILGNQQQHSNWLWVNLATVKLPTQLGDREGILNSDNFVIQYLGAAQRKAWQRKTPIGIALSYNHWVIIIIK